MGEAIPGVYGKSLYLPLHFAVNLKLLLKNIFFKDCLSSISREITEKATTAVHTKDDRVAMVGVGRGDVGELGLC